MADFRTLSDSSKPVNEWALRSDKHLKWAKRLWKFFLIGMGIFALSIIVFSFLTPSFKKLEDPSLNLASEVISDDDTTVLGRIYIHNRAPVAFENIPKHMVKALLATEDLRFYNHSGVDPEALLRVFVKTFLLQQKGQGGGSTLTMQLAKLLYSDRDFKDMNFLEKAFGYYYRKLSEMITAIKLERAYTKEEIVTMYLNTYDFGYNAHGIRAASEVYFAKAPEQLNFEEAATLVGMCNNSSLYNPIKRNEKTRLRRNLVLERCKEQNIITEKQYKELTAKALDITKFKNRTQNDGLATYFRMTLAADIKEMLKKIGVTKSDGSAYDVFRDGLKIYTTIDPEMQRIAEESMREHMASLQAKYFRVWRGRDPWTYKDAETTDEMIQKRRAILEAQIRQTDRFQMLRGRFLDAIESKIEEDINGIELTDGDIAIMISQDKNRNLFQDMIKKGTLTSKRAEYYRNIMSSKYWTGLKSAWEKLQVTARSEFNKPVPMKVFAYNYAGEKDTVMSPLDSLRYHRMIMQLGSLGIEPTTGHVKFWVGGTNMKYFQVDHVKIDRQVGSTFKPFVYATAISQFGVSPCQTMHDVAQTIGVGEGSFGLIQPWTPKNATGYSGSTLTFWEALKESRNTASVYLVKQMGSTQPIREIVHEMGIDVDAKHLNGQLRVPKTPSICLGAVDLTVFEMAGAYAAFANSGSYTKPLYIRRITDKSGKVLFQGIPEKHSALSEQAAYVMLQMMKYNVRSAAGFKKFQSEIGGKTGTTNDYHDGWFMGVTPNLVVGTWVGGEDQWIRFLRIEDGQGSAMARPFFSKVMERLEKSPNVHYNKDARFKKPEGSLGITLNCGDYYNSGNEGLEGTDEESSGTPGGSGGEFDPNRFQDETPEPPKPAATPPSVKLNTSPTKPPTTPNKPSTQTPAPKINQKSVPQKPKPDDGFEN
jgi:penicillin-binding protein 1A